MKKLILTLVVALAASYSQADVTTNTVPFGGGSVSNLTSQNFLVTMMQWGTTRYESGLTWPSNDTDVEIGADYQSQTQWANYIAIVKNLGLFYVGVQMENAGIAGTVEQLGARAGYTISNGGDLRIKAGAYAGYQIHPNGSYPKGFVGQPEIRLEKLITGPTLNSPTSPTTFASLTMYYPFTIHGTPASTPGFMVAGGATF
jgi:hypothetical protein